MGRRNKTTALLDDGEITDLSTPDKKKRGPVVSLVTLPFRLLRAVIGLAVTLVGALIAMVRLPIRAAVASTRLVVNTASDVVFGIWRLVAKVLGLLTATVAFGGRRIGGIWRLLGKAGQTTTQRMAFIGTGIRVVSHGLGRILVAVVTGAIGATIGAASLAVRTIVGIATLALKIVFLPLRLVGIGRRGAPEVPLDVTP